MLSCGPGRSLTPTPTPTTASAGPARVVPPPGAASPGPGSDPGSFSAADVETDRLAAIKARTLAIGGSLSPAWLPAAARAVADAIPGARYVTLEGQDHGVLNQPAALRSLLLDFLT